MKLLVIALAALAQTGGDLKNEAPAKPAPVIPIELQAEYFRSDGVLAHLRADLAQANADYEAAVKAILAACGAGYIAVPTEDKKHLYCAVQPAAAAPKK